MNLSILLEQYELYARSTNISKSSVKLYVNRVSRFSKWLEKDILKTDVHDVRKFKIYMTDDKGLDGKTFNQYRAGMVSFFNFLIEEKHVESNPIVLVKSAKIYDKAKESLSINDVKKMIDFCKSRGHKNSIRNLAMLEIFAKTGLRVEEVQKLNVSQVKDKTIWNDVKVKGGGIRVIDLSHLPEVKEAIQMYIDSRPNVGNDALFISNKGNRMSIDAIRDKVKQIGKYIGIDFITPHVLRATLSDSVFHFTRDTVLAQIAIGHKIKSVIHKHYVNLYTRAQVASEVVRDTYDNYNPNQGRKYGYGGNN